jgi:hypothetical protein
MQKTPAVPSQDADDEQDLSHVVEEFIPYVRHKAMDAMSPTVYQGRSGISAYRLKSAIGARFQIDHPIDAKHERFLADAAASSQDAHTPVPPFNFTHAGPKHIYYLVKGDSLGLGPDQEHILAMQTIGDAIGFLVYEQGFFRDATEVERERIVGRYGQQAPADGWSRKP